MQFKTSTEYRKWDEFYLRCVFERGDAHATAASKADLYIEGLRVRADVLLTEYAASVQKQSQGNTND